MLRKAAGLAAAAWVLSLPATAPGQEAQESPITAQPDGPLFEVSAFKFRYAMDHPLLPGVDRFAELTVDLVVSDGPQPTYAAPAEGGTARAVPMAELMAEHPGRRFTVGAINAVGIAIVKALNAEGISGPFVLPDTEEIDPTGRDQRPGSAGPLTLLIHPVIVGAVHSTASGERFAGDAKPGDEPAPDLVDRPEHARIRRLSPVRPSGTGDAQRRDLFRAGALDDYLYRLNRRPGRSVTVAAGEGSSPGQLALDYGVAENKPWTIFAQADNTGTEQTKTWRERIGFVHNQLTNRDDTLSLQYITAELDAVNAVTGSYDAPLGDSMLWRGRVFGSWSEYTASELGFGDAEFNGRGYSLGADVSREIYHSRELFIDAFAGVHFDHNETNNEVAQVVGDADFVLPNIGLRLERLPQDQKSSLLAAVTLETSLPGLTGVDDAQAEQLGRTGADAQWTTIRADLSYSFFLEPLLMGKAFDDPATPDSKVTMAHEVAFSLRGQYAFGARLIPQQVDTAGGFYTVRGYPEALSAGDNAIIASAEYRFHLPRALGVDAGPADMHLFGRPVHLQRQQRYGRADWDLIFRGFVDAAQTVNNDRLSFETDDTLIGAGVGVELQILRNFNARVDWGVALEDASGGAVTAGSDRFHISFTGLF